MSLGRWVLGAVTVGVTLGAAGAQAGPLPLVPMGDQHSVQNVQFFFDDPPPVYYDPPPRPYYRDYRPREYYPPPPRAYYAPPPRAYYAPPPRRYGPPPPRYGNRQQQQLYTKGQVRAWNRANGF